MEIKLYECTQCGSTNYEQVGPKRVRCAHCGSLFRVLTDEPTLVISKGANVHFGKTADVEIRGDLDIEDGAEVNIEGKVTVRKGGQQRLFKLELIEGED
jgi:DNA-directed RNA polymerase subunit RPC12/RpoP